MLPGLHPDDEAAAMLDIPRKREAALQQRMDAFVRLHNFMWASKLLPIRDWGKGRGLGGMGASGKWGRLNKNKLFGAEW